MIRFLKIQDDDDRFRRFVIGTLNFARYSPKAAERPKEARPDINMTRAWQESAMAGKRST